MRGVYVTCAGSAQEPALSDALLEGPIPRALSSHHSAQELLEPSTAGSLYGCGRVALTFSAALLALALAVSQYLCGPSGPLISLAFPFSPPPPPAPPAQAFPAELLEELLNICVKILLRLLICLTLSWLGEVSQRII